MRLENWERGPAARILDLLGFDIIGTIALALLFGRKSIKGSYIGD
jgi:hypothetical protein